jgi:hypothetical protein
MEVDVVERTVMGDVETLVDLALAVHALAALRFAQWLSSARQRHGRIVRNVNGTDPRLDEPGTDVLLGSWTPR